MQSDRDDKMCIFYMRVFSYSFCAPHAGIWDSLKALHGLSEELSVTALKVERKEKRWS